MKRALITLFLLGFISSVYAGGIAVFPPATGHGGQFLRVNASATSFEWATASVDVATSTASVTARVDIILALPTSTVDLTLGTPSNITIDSIDNVIMFVDSGVQPRSKYSKLSNTKIAFGTAIASGSTISLLVNQAASSGGGGTGSVSAYITINPQTATYTLVLTDAGKLVTMDTSSTTTNLVQSIIVPPVASVAWVDGTQISLLREGVGEVRIIGATGVTINSVATSTVSASTGNAWLLQQYSAASLIYKGSNVFYLLGHLKEGY